jgi:hypothetical protein
MGRVIVPYSCVETPPHSGTPHALISGMLPLIAPAVVNSIWTAFRGAEVINCELVTIAQGRAVLRCGYGPQRVIRSQFIASEEAAAAVSETWKAALLLQGFRIE